MYPWRRPYVDKDFADNWFNETHHLNLNKLDLVDLRAATKDQLFFFNRHSYEQTDRIAMGSCLVKLLNKHTHVETKVHVKPTNTGLLLHYKSHVDDRYKRGLPKPMLDRALRLSSNCCCFFEECDRLKLLFSRLNILTNLSTLLFHVLLPPKHRINLFLRRLSAIEQTPFALSYSLKIRPQPILYVSNLKI
ncbi:unnamed protein product [Pocillopora meandrina]|uniref:Helix-turn-helix domain-containing protein n=1 Tax=Pocillopora meandrina TaxID=46732 RepID=A0AAU9X0X7_9CNID|nr:unnamed protein product [Pocillopora meandrina]